MSMPRHGAKRDRSEPEIVNTLIECGFSVVRMDTPVDLLVGFRKRTWLVEAKSGHKGYAKTLNANQKSFADTWRGSEVVILRDAQEARDWAVQVSQEAA